MCRKNVKHYAGASSTIKPEALAKLGPAYMVQPKMDGAYVHVHLDRFGCIARISSRSGQDYENGNITGLIGEFVGYPGAVLVGELTAHTIAGNADAEAFGARRIHLFDCAFGMDTKPLVGLPYSERRAELFKMQAAIATYGPGQSWLQGRNAAQDKRTGKFVAKTHRGLVLVPIVPQYRANSGEVAELWDRVKSRELEGLVAVSQRAKIGSRSSKRKCKIADTVDVLILSADAKLAKYWYNGQFGIVRVGKSGAQKGDMVSLKYNGVSISGQLRSHRIDRIRHDLMVDD